MHRRIKIFICFMLSIFCSGVLQAADCCSPVNQRIHAALRQAAAQNLSSFEVDLGSVNSKLRPRRPARTNMSQPLIVIYQNGLNSLDKDLDPDDECWDLYWTYVVGAYVYFGLIATNYEDTDEPIQLKFKAEGPKNILIKRSKIIPAKSVVAYFVRLKLAQQIGTYLLTTALLSRQASPYVLLDQLQTYSYVSDVQF